MSLRIVMPGDPVPQNTGKVGRWRSKDGREGTTIRQPAKVIRYKLELEARMQEATAAAGWTHSGPYFGEGPVSLSLEVVFPCPKSDYRKRAPMPRRPHTGRYGNLDNLLKAIGDAGEGALWRDDGQICHLRDVKKWIGAQGEAPRVEVVVEAFVAPPEIAVALPGGEGE
jgi:Holliday junction resolvase RusA-like endonuclease